MPYSSEPTINSWTDVERCLQRSPAPDGSDDEQQALWQAQHTFVATLAYALHRLPNRSRCVGRGAAGRWCVWVLGAREEVEGQLVRHGLLAEPLARLYPSSPGWQFELIGPELGDWRTGDAFASVDGQHNDGHLPPIVRARRGTLHHLLAGQRSGEDALPTADLAVAFHAGFGTLLTPLAAPWLPTLLPLLAQGTPFLVTSYHAGESDGEEQLLRALGATTITRAADCPVRAAVPTDALEDASFASATAQARAARRVAKHAAKARQAEAERGQLRRPASDGGGCDGGGCDGGGCDCGGCDGGGCDGGGPERAGEDTGERRAGQLYDWHNNPEPLRMRETCNSRFQWVCGGTAATTDDRLLRAHELLRSTAVAVAPVRLQPWLGSVVQLVKTGLNHSGRALDEALAATAPQPIGSRPPPSDAPESAEDRRERLLLSKVLSKFDETAIDAELLAEATSDARVAVRTAALYDGTAPSMLKLAVFMSDRTAVRWQDALSASHRMPPEKTHAMRTPSYTGVNAIERFGTACRTLLGNMERAGAIPSQK